MPLDQPLSVNASAYATTRSSTELARKSQHRMSRLDQFQASRPSSARLSEPAINDTLHVENNSGDKRQSTSVDGLRTWNDAQERLAAHFRKFSPSKSKQDRPASRIIIKSGEITRENSKASTNHARSDMAAVEMGNYRLERQHTPEYFRDRSRRATDIHAALSSNPVHPASAPVKPLPTPPDDATLLTSANTKNTMQNSSPEEFFDARNGVEKSTDNGAGLTSNSSDRVSSREQFTKAVFAPVDRGNDVRSLHAMSSYLRRGDSTSTRAETPENSGVDDLYLPEQQIQMPHSTGNTARSSPQPSTLREVKNARTSFQRDRSETVRARKLRDLQRGRQSVEGSEGSRPVSRSKLLDTYGEEKQASVRLEPSPDISLKGAHTSQSAFPIPSNGKHTVSAAKQERENHISQPSEDTDQYGWGQEENITSQDQHLSVAESPAEDNSTMNRHEPQSILKDESVMNSHPHLYRTASKTVATIASTTIEPESKPQPTFPPPVNQPQTRSVIPEKKPPPPIIQGPVRSSLEHLAMENNAVSGAPSPSLHPPKSPTASFKSQKSTARSSARQSEYDPQARLQARVDHLERENKLLEAALMAVLRTSGRLNGCPCGGTLRPPNDIHAAHNNAMAGSSGSKRTTGSQKSGVEGGKLDADVDRLDAAYRQSMISNGTSSWGDAEPGAFGKRPLDLYMATRAGHRVSVDPPAEVNGKGDGHSLDRYK